MQGTMFAHRSGGEARDPTCSRNNKLMQTRIRTEGQYARMLAVSDNQRSGKPGSELYRVCRQR